MLSCKRNRLLPFLTPYSKDRKMKTEKKHLLNSDFRCLNVLFFLFYDFRVVKIFKLIKICIQMIKAITPKQPIKTMNLLCRFNEGVIKIQILINNPLRKKSRECATSENLVCQAQDVL